MPILLVVLLLLGLVAFSIVSIPFGLLLRYRAGTARRRARWWIASLNLYAATISAVILLATSAVSNAWIPRAFVYTAAGLGAGFLLGVIGLLMTRWEISSRSMYYTPSRLLILGITLVVIGRISFGLWRGWHAWHSTPADQSWLAASGAAGSLGAGALVLGYYVVYWLGLRRRINRLARNA